MEYVYLILDYLIERFGFLVTALPSHNIEIGSDKILPTLQKWDTCVDYVIEIGPMKRGGVGRVRIRVRGYLCRLNNRNRSYEMRKSLAI